MNFGDWTSAIQNIAQIAAIVIGGTWAYYKFFRGRTYHRRAEVDLDASLIALGSSEAILAHVTVENTGGAKIPFDFNEVAVSSFRRGDVDARGRPIWRAVEGADALVLLDHRGIESRETISDDVLVPLPPSERDQDVLAFRVTCKVWDKPRLWNEIGIRWTTNAILPRGQATENGTQERGSKGRSDGRSGSNADG
jgi:hypothetical protein